MQISIEEKGGEVVVVMNGSFTFSDNQQFRTTLKELQQKSASVIGLEMSGVDFIDSAALGMLLLLRDTMQTSGTALELRNPQGQIRKMFELSNFNDLFTIKG